ncbi:MAG TPA: hypothetical protein PLO16_01225 [Acidocella sp.]|nr:hypothetical protein [Acidocella sp.]
MLKRASEKTSEPPVLPRTPSLSWADFAWPCAVFIITVVLCLPILRAVYDLGDEAVLLNGAARMLRGEHLYTDFFEFLPPGGFVLTAFWFSLTGISVLATRMLQLLVIGLVVSFTFLATRQATKNAPLSAILVIGYVLAVPAQVLMQLGHHWFTNLFALIAFWLALCRAEKPPQRAARCLPSRHDDRRGSHGDAYLWRPGLGRRCNLLCS